MTALPLKFQSGDTLAIRDAAGAMALWGVVERKRGGYLLKPHDGSVCIGLQHWASFRGDRRPITSHP